MSRRAWACTRLARVLLRWLRWLSAGFRTRAGGRAGIPALGESPVVVITLPKFQSECVDPLRVLSRGHVHIHSSALAIAPWRAKPQAGFLPRICHSSEQLQVVVIGLVPHEYSPQIAPLGVAKLGAQRGWRIKPHPILVSCSVRHASLHSGRRIFDHLGVKFVLEVLYLEVRQITRLLGARPAWCIADRRRVIWRVFLRCGKRVGAAVGGYAK